MRDTAAQSTLEPTIVGADEVHARAERDRRELRVRARAHKAVDDLVQRAVAPDCHDDARAVSRGALRELDQMSRALGEERLALEPEPGGAVRKLGPALPGCAVVGRRIDEERGLRSSNGRR